MRSAMVLAALLFMGASVAQAVPVRAIPGLVSVTFYERTGGVAPNAFTFAVDSSQLTTRLPDPLGGSANFDIAGASTEYYDVFFSNEDGTFNLDGEYLSIEGVFLQTLPAGGGLNLAEIALNFAASPVEYGNFVASFLALGDNSFPGNVGRAIDGDLLTHTTMGNTVGSDQRLRVTLGFESSSGPPPTPAPEPGTLALLVLGLAGLGMSRRRLAVQTAQEREVPMSDKGKRLATRVEGNTAKGGASR
jgi:hypothetical protein